VLDLLLILFNADAGLLWRDRRSINYCYFAERDIAAWLPPCPMLSTLNHPEVPQGELKNLSTPLPR
jgi:hypothetical protein